MCDSRNLNLSPFCNLTSTSLVKWQPDAKKAYAGIKNANYISELNEPMRPKYPPNKAQEELLPSLTEVKHFCRGYFYKNFNVTFFHKKGDQMYNAYEKDIAVVNLYFGDSTSFGKLS